MFEPMNLRDAADRLCQITDLLKKLESAMMAREALSLNYAFAFFVLTDDSVVMFADQVGSGCVYHGHVKLGTEMEMLSEISEILDSTSVFTHNDIADLTASFEDAHLSVEDAYEAIVLKALRGSVQHVVLRHFT